MLQMYVYPDGCVTETAVWASGVKCRKVQLRGAHYEPIGGSSDPSARMLSTCLSTLEMLMQSVRELSCVSNSVTTPFKAQDQDTSVWLLHSTVWELKHPGQSPRVGGCISAECKCFQTDILIFCILVAMIICPRYTYFIYLTTLFSNSDYTNYVESIRTEATVALSKILSRLLPGELGKTMRNLSQCSGPLAEIWTRNLPNARQEY